MQYDCEVHSMAVYMPLADALLLSSNVIQLSSALLNVIVMLHFDLGKKSGSRGGAWARKF
jgi:hypothetical protein